jgi:hypothetical protein
MLAIRRRLSCAWVASLFVLRIYDCVAAPACADLSGQWNETGQANVPVYWYQLVQNTNSTITGTTTILQTVGTCPTSSKWNVSGQYTGSGKFTIQATYQGGTGACVAQFTETLAVSGAGCTVANTSWIENYGSGPSGNSQWTAVGNFYPSGETTTFENWYSPGVALFEATLTAPQGWSSVGYNFGGRTIQETFPSSQTFPTGGLDGCWWPNSLIGYYKPSAASAFVKDDQNGGNTYADRVGFTDTDFVDYYRLVLNVPCSIQANQQMTIDSRQGPYVYAKNLLVMYIWDTTITVLRGPPGAGVSSGDTTFGIREGIYRFDRAGPVIWALVMQ